MSSTLRARRAKAHKGESLHPDGKQALPCCRSRYIVHNGKRKLTAVCSHQTRIGNLDAHLI